MKNAPTQKNTSTTSLAPLLRRKYSGSTVPLWPAAWTNPLKKLVISIRPIFCLRKTTIL